MKSALLRALRRAIRTARAPHRRGTHRAGEVSEGQMISRPDRREFLHQATFGAASTAALWLPLGCRGSTGSRSPETRRSATAGRVAIVGAGMAGLHCAYRLLQSEIRPDVFEASPRTGGRMFSARYEDLSFELGGELIDTNHVTMHALAEELNIKLDDVTADYPSDSEFRAEIFWLTGQEISHATLLEQLGSFADVVRAANRVEEGPAFSAIDAMSISQWLEVHRTPNPLKQVLEAAYTMEFGIPADKQTAFNLIWMLGKDPQFSSAAAGQRVSEFQIFGASDERYRAHEGNQSFTDALLQRVGGTRSIRYGNRLIAIKRDSGGSLRLVFATAGGTREHSYERVVVAIPFSVLREVDLTALALDKHLTLEGTGPDKQTVIDTLGYGTNAKVMMFFREPVWRTRHNSSGVAITDDLLEEIWDTTRGQRSKLCVLTNFTGGADGGRSSGAGTPEQAAAQRLPLIDAIFPGTAATYIAGSAARFHWPTAPHHKGSYCAYRVGQAAFYGSEQEPVGNLHFCGEHTSSDFQGWMEGAAESGARAASEVIASMGKKASLPLAQIVLAARMAAANRVIPGDVRARRQHLARTIRTRRCSAG